LVAASRYRASTDPRRQSESRVSFTLRCRISLGQDVIAVTRGLQWILMSAVGSEKPIVRSMTSRMWRRRIVVVTTMAMQLKPGVHRGPADMSAAAGNTASNERLMTAIPAERRSRLPPVEADDENASRGMAGTERWRGSTIDREHDLPEVRTLQRLLGLPYLRPRQDPVDDGA